MDGWMVGWRKGWMDVFLASLFSCEGGDLATGRCQVSRSPTKILIKALKLGKVIQERMNTNWLVGGDYILRSYRIFHVSERR